jgi:hypothetical protein
MLRVDGRRLRFITQFQESLGNFYEPGDRSEDVQRLDRIDFAAALGNDWIAFDLANQLIAALDELLRDLPFGPGHAQMGAPEDWQNAEGGPRQCPAFNDHVVSALLRARQKLQNLAHAVDRNNPVAFKAFPTAPLHRAFAKAVDRTADGRAAGQRSRSPRRRLMPPAPLAEPQPSEPLPPRHDPLPALPKMPLLVLRSPPPPPPRRFYQ